MVKKSSGEHRVELDGQEYDLCCIDLLREVAEEHIEVSSIGWCTVYQVDANNSFIK